MTNYIPYPVAQHQYFFDTNMLIVRPEYLWLVFLLGFLLGLICGFQIFKTIYKK